MKMFLDGKQNQWAESIEERLNKLESAPNQNKYKGNLDNLPKYAYYGEVRALEIKWYSIDLYGKFWLHFNEPNLDTTRNFNSLNVSREWCSEKSPKSGDYIVFDEDGYYHLLTKEEFDSVYFRVAH